VARAIFDRLHCDLIDVEDVFPAWYTTLADLPNEGPVRDEVGALRDQALRQADPRCWSAAQTSMGVVCAG